MKTSILISLLFIAGCCSRSKLDTVTKVPMNETTKKVCFVESHEVDSATQLELYSRAREWFVRTFVSSKAVLEMDDKEAGKLIGKAVGQIPQQPKTWNTHFSVFVYVKDGKYRSEFSDIYYEYPKENSSTDQVEMVKVYAEDVISPTAISDCACMISRARIKWRDGTMRLIKDLQISLNAAMNTDDDF